MNDGNKHNTNYLQSNQSKYNLGCGKKLSKIQCTIPQPWWNLKQGTSGWLLWYVFSKFESSKVDFCILNYLGLMLAW